VKAGGTVGIAEKSRCLLFTSAAGAPQFRHKKWQNRERVQKSGCLVH
jgi:hypothetical protein